jgi:D-sedoheptulose 7-phosphate isomerase
MRTVTGASMNAVQDYLVRSRDTIPAALDDPAFAIAEIVEAIANALGNGCKLPLAGNGGSAAGAQHLAREIVSRMNYDRAPAATLATDSSVITAIGNDYGYDRVFERQIPGLGSPEDVFIAISIPGRSPNILRAIEAARRRRMVLSA